ncbi:unnamed protein product, partial [Tetraodon nigroviridis]
VLETRLSQPDCSSRGWILHGFPQNLDQARILQGSQYQPNRVYFLDLSDEVCLSRVSLRATDPVSGQRSVQSDQNQNRASSPTGAEEGPSPPGSTL